MFRFHDALGAKILLFWARSVVRMGNPWKVAKIRNMRWCVGTCACCLVVEVQFGHAGAQARGDLETTAAKNKDMEESGIHVPESYFSRFFQTVVGIFYSLTEPWRPSKKVKGSQRIPAISEPHSLKGQRSCMDDGRS